MSTRKAQRFQQPVSEAGIRSGEKTFAIADKLEAYTTSFEVTRCS
jgi:hypothetical protein